MEWTYDEILERMNQKFFELSGYEADRVSDIGIRLRLLAGEVFSLSSDIDFIKRQIFPTTATGKYLELHAQQRGLERIQGNKSKGEILFQLDNPIEYELTIPKGTLCTNSDGTLNFVTDEDAKIPRGGNFALIEATAQNSGTQYNVSPNKITTIITYFSVGIGISNSSAFSGGTDDETDEGLRERIIYSMRNIPNGANKEYYISLAKSVDGIQSATVIGQENGAGSISIYLGGRGCIPSETDYRMAQAKIRDNKAVGIDITVSRATAVSVGVDVSISIESGYDFETVKENVRSAIINFFNEISAGEKVSLTALGDVIFHCDGVTDYSFNNMTDTIITLKQQAILTNISINRKY